MYTAKIKILKETFEKTFNLERFKKFTKEFFNEPEMLIDKRHSGIWKEYSDHINTYHTIAKYNDSSNNSLIVMAVELKNNSSVDRARSMQRNFISKVLDENGLEAAIVAFYTADKSSWRMSFVRLDYSFTEKGIKLDLTPARRYSYLVGENEPNHTAQEQLLPLFEDDTHNPSLDQIEDAFSVEKVTKEFFKQYKEKYLELKEYLENDESFKTETHKLGFEVEKFSEQFSKKLMGQLSFLYFLQKKGWLGVRIMPASHSISKSDFIELYNNQDSIHKSILDKLFKTTQDNEMKLSSRKLYMIDEHEAELLSDCFHGTNYDMPWGSGNKLFLREIYEFCRDNTNKNFFGDYLEPFFYDALNKKRKNQYFKKFNCKIPFLNGGLFEPLEDYHWKDVNFNIPNSLFSNKREKGREANGILDIFDRFNFTMNEDEPLEKEVAVDPEMLGKIFENLLEVSDRKSKGAFYTPREIVHYMCQESLVNYLVTEVNVPYEDMKEFILYGELIRDADSRSNVGFGKGFTIKKSILDNIVDIDDALKNVKVADPAVGSGAFPLGMLNEIVRARNNITEYIVRKDRDGSFGKTYGEAFIRKWREPYKMKWDTIKNSIFAVDIEPSAVDITKLRLWLSVVVDQKIDEDNLEPHPLPNLDMNIHVGNSLIDEYEGIKLFDSSILSNKRKKKSKKNSGMHEQLRLFFDSDEILKEMYDKQNQYFDEANEKTKKDLKDRIDFLQDQLIVYRLNESNNNSALEKYKSVRNKKSKPYFLWELDFAKVFQDKGGFDIVIGNPPYVRQEEIVEIKNVLKNNYKSYSARADLYVYFYEKSVNVLNSTGVISFITSNKWFRVKYGEKLRSYLINNCLLKDVIDFGGFQVFESASVDTNILIAMKNSEYKSYKFNALVVDSNTFSNSRLNLHSVFDEKSFKYASDDLDVNCFVFEKEHILNIKNKSILYGQPLKDWNIKIKCGFKTGLNEAFVISNEKKEALCNHDSNSVNVLRKCLRGKDVKKNKIDWNGLWIIVAKFDFHKEIGNYDAIRQHLDGFEVKLKNRGQCKYSRSKKNDVKKAYTGQHHWYELDNNPKEDIIKMFEESEKILYPDIAQGASFYYDTEQFFSQETCFAITGEKLKYLVGLLNSKAVTYIYKKFYAGGGLGDKALRYKKAFLEKLPIPIADVDIEKTIIDLVDKLRSFSQSEIDRVEVTEIETEIDEIVYGLFHLDLDEIDEIEKSFK